MNHAHLSRSPRLQRALRVLQEARGWISTREWRDRADLCAVNSVKCELVENGIRVECRCVGHGRYEYRLAPEPVQAALFEEAAA